MNTIKYKNYLSDVSIMIKRSMLHTFRSVDTIITVIAMPIMIMLLFVYVLGGAIDTGVSSYIDYMLPGILLMAISSGVAYAAVRLNSDITKGIFERFHSMPIAKSSILWGHVITSVLSCTISLIVIVLIALLMGFRSSAGIESWLLIIGILLLFTLATTWLAIISGLLAKNVEGAGVFAYPLMFLPFISSAFVPTATMPGPVRFFAEYQPVTSIIETLRNLMLNRAVDNNIWIALGWCFVLLITSFVIATRIYYRKIKQ